MTEEVSTLSSVDADVSTRRQRKKRKWDQPAEAVIPAAASIPGLLPFNGSGALSGIGLPGMFPSLMGVFPSVPTATASAQISPAVSTVQQNAAAIVQKINQDLATKGLVSQTKMQDELIAREIVINDAEPGVRYKLTKRQTQEEIQAKTGAVVITRGRYRPPNGAVDHEKPLYLHISAGVHLKDTAERIRAVDQAAALVDEMLKMGRHKLAGSTSTSQLSSGLITSPLSTVVFVEFEADSSLNLISRIRGPNDQYINHIMAETGATVVLKGGSCDSSCTEEIPQPLHLFISADHPKSLDDARSLAENLLETIRSEFVCPRPPYIQPAVSYSLQQTVTPFQVPPYVTTSLEPGRVLAYSLAQPSSVSVLEKVTPALSQPAVSTSASAIVAESNVNRAVFSKAYTAVPPPKQLLTVDKSTEKCETESESVRSETKSDRASASSAESPASSSASLPMAAMPISVPASNALVAYTGYPALSYSQQSYGIYPQALQGSQPYSPMVTSYSAYSGLYPQASPLQQVALALQRPPHQVSLKPPSLASDSAPLAKSQSTAIQGQVEKQEKQRRKFQEFPLRPKGPSIDQPVAAQRVEQLSSTLLSGGKQQSMPPPNAVPPLSTNIKLTHVMGPPPPKAAPSTTTHSAVSNVQSRSMPPPPAPLKTQSISRVETSAIEGIKLVEYGEDEDDVGITDIDRTEATPYANGKPFWAV